ncbi:MAG: hypothetical protein QW512_05915 [Thermofilaceae archaeon]
MGAEEASAWRVRSGWGFLGKWFGLIGFPAQKRWRHPSIWSGSGKRGGGREGYTGSWRLKRS